MKKEITKILKQLRRNANRKSGAGVMELLLKENSLYYDFKDKEKLTSFDTETDYRIKNNIPENKKLLTIEYV